MIGPSSILDCPVAADTACMYHLAMGGGESCRQCRAPGADDELCGECAARLERCGGLLPEHIAGANQDGDAFLIDPWGRAHPLFASGSLVGRTDAATVTLLHQTVSREHAKLWRSRGGGWRRDA